jgi:hypothetical protein
MRHNQYCRTLIHSDAAKRLSDAYTMHRLADPIGNIGRWFAVAIADGTSGDMNTLYDSRLDAITHQHHNEQYYVFIQIVPSNMPVCDAEIYLAAVRKTYDARKSLLDRDHRNGGRDIITRLTAEDQIAQSRGYNSTNLIVPGRNNHK